MKTISDFEIDEIWRESDGSWWCSINIWDENNHRYIIPQYLLGEKEPDEVDAEESICLEELESEFNDWYIQNY